MTEPQNQPQPSPPRFKPESAPYRCPQCGAAASASVQTIVDAADPAVKEAFLAGRLNVVTCPSCRRPTRASVPLLYHDAGADIAYVFLPGGLQVTAAEQERAVGRLTNRVLDSLPPDQRRMYLLQPKTFVNEAGFMDAVLAANGVSPEMAERARRTAELVNRLLAAPDEAGRKAVLDDAGQSVDYELLSFISAMANQAAAQGATGRAKAVMELRDALAAMAGLAGPGGPAGLAGEHGEPTVTLDELLEMLQAARDDGLLQEAVAELRPILDYSFFVELTRRMDSAGAAGESAKSEALRDLRAALVAAVDEVDARARAAIEQAVDTLRAVLASADPLAALRERAGELDEAFFMVLESNLQAAEADGRADIVARLGTLYEAATGLYEENLPALQRMVNRLARAPDVRARAAIMDAAPELVGPDLEHALQQTAAAARSAGATPIADTLLAAAAEVGARLNGAAGPGKQAAT